MEFDDDFDFETASFNQSDLEHPGKKSSRRDKRKENKETKEKGKGKASGKVMLYWIAETKL
jgi:hypothetical protein